MVDVVPMKKNYTWSFEVENEENSSLQSLFWPKPEVRSSEHKLILMDVEEQKIIDMKELQNYSFIKKATSHSFQIFYGSQSFIEEAVKPQKVHIGKLYPNPTFRQLNVPIALIEKGATYQVRLRLYDLEGKEALIVQETEFQEGFHTWKLNLPKLVDGVYLVKVDIVAPDGTYPFSQKIMIKN